MRPPSISCLPSIGTSGQSAGIIACPVSLPDSYITSASCADEVAKLQQQLRQMDDRALQVYETFLAQNPGAVRMVFVELMLASSGLVISPHFAVKLREISHRHGVLVAVDECYTFLRVAGGLMCRSPSYREMMPDIVVGGKAGFGFWLAAQTRPSDWSQHTVPTIMQIVQPKNVSVLVSDTSSEGAFVFRRDIPPPPDAVWWPLLLEIASLSQQQLLVPSVRKDNFSIDGEVFDENLLAFDTSALANRCDTCIQWRAPGRSASPS